MTMNEREERVTHEGATGRDDSDRIERLLRLAASRSPVPEDRFERVEIATADRWRRAVARRRRRRLATWVGGGLAAAASVLLVLSVGPREVERTAVAPVELAPEVATLERSTGVVRRGAPYEVALRAGEPVRVGEVVSTSEAGRAALRLASGHSIRLDVGTRVRFGAAGELTLDRGALYVDSGPAGGDERGVIVRTPLGQVTEMGTQFEVRLAGDGVRVRVREGAVVVARSDETFDAAAGGELTVLGNGAVERGTVALHGPEWAWIQEVAPSFDLEGETLEEFLEWVARETGRGVRFPDDATAKSAGEIVLHGTIEELTPEQALAAVLPTCGLSHRYDGGDLLIGKI